MEIQDFLKKRLVKAQWAHVETTLSGLSQNCLIFEKNTCFMLIETGYIHVNESEKIKQRNRDRIKILSKQNADRFNFKHFNHKKIYYGYVTNETMPRIKCLYKL